jgi:small subunit ribosomal protein S21
MLKIPVKKGNIEKALKMLKRKVRNVKQLEELRERKEYEKPSSKKRKEIIKAIHEQKKIEDV